MNNEAQQEKGTSIIGYALSYRYAGYDDAGFRFFNPNYKSGRWYCHRVADAQVFATQGDAAVKLTEEATRCRVPASRYSIEPVRVSTVTKTETIRTVELVEDIK